ncbi:MAG: GNAT family N-acetyltransferase [Gaiella sp.]
MDDTALAFWRSQGFHSRSTDTDGVLTVLVLHQRGDARIRPARADEAEVLLGIQRDAAVARFGQIFPPDLYPFPDEPVRDGWVAALADPWVEVYVAELDGAVVGSVAVEDEWLRTLYVVPSRWGAGTGTALHDYALERVRQTGVPDARLWTLEGNAAGRRFYERRGWVETGRTRAVPFPPYPLDVEYRRSLCDRLDAPDRSGNER